MQIFEYDYKTGKGKKVGDLHCSGVGMGLGFAGPGKSTPEHTRGMVVHEHLVNTPNYNDPDWQFEFLTADDYGCRAITCCLGQRGDKWEWIVVCNKEDAAKAIERNQRLFGHDHWKFIN